jgi:hypothetical protein
MPRNTHRLPRLMKHYCPTGKRNQGRPLKRHLDMWDQNGPTSGPTPWQIYDDDYITVEFYELLSFKFVMFYCIAKPGLWQFQFIRIEVKYIMTNSIPYVCITRSRLFECSIHYSMREWTSNPANNLAINLFWYACTIRRHRSEDTSCITSTYTEIIDLTWLQFWPQSFSYRVC